MTPRRFAILVHRKLMDAEHRLEVNDIHINLVELLRPRKGSTLFVPNLYRPRNGSTAPLLAPFRNTFSIIRRRPLLVVGDFNANHTSWGYKKCRKGPALLTFIQIEDMPSSVI